MAAPGDDLQSWFPWLAGGLTSGLAALTGWRVFMSSTTKDIRALQAEDEKIKQAAREADAKIWLALERHKSEMREDFAALRNEIRESRAEIVTAVSAIVPTLLRNRRD